MWKRAMLLGVVAGLSILVRAATLLFVPLSALWLIYKRRWITLAGLALGLVLVLTPWTIRNINFYGHFVLVASDGGVTFWTGNNKLATGEGDMAANPHLKLANQELRGAASASERRTDGADLLPGIARLDPRAPRRLAVAHGAQGLLSRRADWAVVQGALGAVLLGERPVATACSSRSRPSAAGGSDRAAAGSRECGFSPLRPSQPVSCSFRRNAFAFP